MHLILDSGWSSKVDNLLLIQCQYRKKPNMINTSISSELFFLEIQ